MITKEIIKRKPVVPPSNVHYPTVPWTATKRIAHNQQEWNEYLSAKNWSVGEIVCYDWMASRTRVADIRYCSVLLGINTDYDTLQWVSYNGRTNYLFLMGLGGYLGAHTSYETKPFIRWTDDEKMRTLTEEEKNGLIDDNLLDYIQKITAKYVPSKG